MLLVTDEEAQVRSLDWEDFSPRLHQLLKLLDSGGVRLEPKSAASEARRAVEAYYGEFAAINSLPVKTAGTSRASTMASSRPGRSALPRRW